MSEPIVHSIVWNQHFSDICVWVCVWVCESVCVGIMTSDTKHISYFSQ